ncbi:MAG: VWA domain-containing protein [Candidatus Thorarchaeota archaeon]|nr:VWA domain-containing protein [Candidatus Thorarchaeota archaeon]
MFDWLAEKNRVKDRAQIVKEAWSYAVDDFYHPPLPEPVIEDQKEASSYFYINPADWTVHINLKGVPSGLEAEAVKSFLRSICHHEIQHYLLCPYDGVTNGMMFAKARKHVDDTNAMFACNLFADLVVDSELMNRFPAITKNRITESIGHSSTLRRSHSNLWRLIVSCYHHHWGLDYPKGLSLDKDTESAAREIVTIAEKYMKIENQWPKATGEIACVLSNWSDKSGEELLETSDDSSVEENGSPSSSRRMVSVPSDADAVMGSPIEIRNRDRMKKCMGEAESESEETEMSGLAKRVVERDGDLDDLEAVYLLSGKHQTKSNWIRFWYRAAVRGMLRIDVTSKSKQGTVPLSPSTWRIGDPVEELDIVQSLQAFPVLVPNISTRRWLKAEISGSGPAASLPNLLVVLDSSGSMHWSIDHSMPKGPFHIALLSAFAAIDFAFKKSKKVAAINFSGSVKSSGLTRKRARIESILTSYQGGSTIAPIQEIRNICRVSEGSLLVLMMTDAEIANWDGLLKTIKRISSDGHRFFLFHIRSSRYSSEDLDTELSGAGAEVIPLDSAEDLFGLVVRETKRIYAS